jgi:hypothetical protein
MDRRDPPGRPPRAADDQRSDRDGLAAGLGRTGIGKLLAPLVRRQVRAEMPRNQQKLKELLEGGA